MERRTKILLKVTSSKISVGIVEGLAITRRLARTHPSITPPTTSLSPAIRYSFEKKILIRYSFEKKNFIKYFFKDGQKSNGKLNSSRYLVLFWKENFLLGMFCKKKILLGTFLKNFFLLDTLWHFSLIKNIQFVSSK